MIKKKECFVCKSTEKLELAHMLSYELVKIIILRQFHDLKLESDTDYEVFHSIIKRVRHQKGDVWLCPEHHRYSDKQQRAMVSLLRRNLKKCILAPEEVNDEV